MWECGVNGDTSGGSCRPADSNATASYYDRARHYAEWAVATLAPEAIAGITVGSVLCACCLCLSLCCSRRQLVKMREENLAYAKVIAEAQRGLQMEEMQATASAAATAATTTTSTPTSTTTSTPTSTTVSTTLSTPHLLPILQAAHALSDGLASALGADDAAGVRSTQV